MAKHRIVRRRVPEISDWAVGQDTGALYLRSGNSLWVVVDQGSGRYLPGIMVPDTYINSGRGVQYLPRDTVVELIL